MRAGAPFHRNTLAYILTLLALVVGASCQDLPSPTSGAGRAVASLPPRCQSVIDATTDGGRTRQPVPSVGDNLSDVHFANPLVGWVGGPAGVWATTDGGANWRELPSPEGGQR